MAPRGKAHPFDTFSSPRFRRRRRTIDARAAGAPKAAVFAPPRSDPADAPRRHHPDAQATLHLPVFFPVDEDHHHRHPLRQRRRAAVFIVVGYNHHPL